jgi:hypothetical protein
MFVCLPSKNSLDHEHLKYYNHNKNEKILEMSCVVYFSSPIRYIILLVKT